MATSPRSRSATGDVSDNYGPGGELHQVSPSAEGALTTNQGRPISDDQNSLKAGPRGAVLLEDFHLREKITHFDHERIPERVVHARGYAAHGFFSSLQGKRRPHNCRFPLWFQSENACVLSLLDGRAKLNMSEPFGIFEAVEMLSIGVLGKRALGDRSKS
jgi:hypothetical protein